MKPESPRTEPRRWPVVVTMGLASAMATLVTWGVLIDDALVNPALESRFLTLAALDPLLAIVAIALCLRVLRRDVDDPARERGALRPALAAIALSTFSGGAVVPAVVAVVSVASRRRWRWTAAAVATLVLAGAANLWVTSPVPPTLGWGEALVGVIMIAFLVIIGMYRGSRRDLMLSLRHEADAARRGQEALVERTRQAERTRIAREMHDSLSHHLALISLHAGALEYRDDLDGERAREVAGVIRDTAKTAGDELRSTLSVLRTDPSDTAPAPTLDRLDALAGDIRTAGTPVSLNVAVDPTPPVALTAHVVRVVQEALTNAVRHAPGAPIDVVVAGTAGQGVRVRVSNPPSDAPSLGGGAGLGLVGLRERLSLVGGTFAAERRSGHFVVEAWVPWET